MEFHLKNKVVKYKITFMDDKLIVSGIESDLENVESTLNTRIVYDSKNDLITTSIK